jgi:uncharacterized protein with PIN domain
VGEIFPASTRPCFLVDASLIKLGRYLRCLGFDAEWDESASARELATRAEDQGRIFVTRSTRLDFEVPRPGACVELRAGDAEQQLAQLVRELGLDARRWLFTRCIRCNVELERVRDREQVRALVAPEVFARQSEFFRCPRCATVFWRGSHVANTCRKLGLEPP